MIALALGMAPAVATPTLPHRVPSQASLSQASLPQAPPSRTTLTETTRSRTTPPQTPLSQTTLSQTTLTQAPLSQTTLTQPPLSQLGTGPGPGPATGAPSACALPARGWHLPGRTGATAPWSEALSHPVILLGERHDSADHHRWQLQVLAALHAQRPELTIGLEMFPRRVQPVLDRWIAGELGEADFLRQSDWQRVWGYDPALYLPILQFARMNRIPLLALNVDRALVRGVATGGWDAVPPEQREGVSRPAAAPERQLARLREVHAAHPSASGSGSVPDAVRFRRFVEAQLVWDRAMAEGIAERLRSRPGGLVVALMGTEHARRDQGVAHQLLSLGQPAPYVMMPLDRDSATPCPAAGADAAQAWFVIPAAARQGAERPRLGVSLESRDRAVVITAVAPGSLAARSGLRVGDRVLAAAGRPLDEPGALVSAVREQPPGTILPMIVSRDGRETEVLVRFPSATP